MAIVKQMPAIDTKAANMKPLFTYDKTLRIIVNIKRDNNAILNLFLKNRLKYSFICSYSSALQEFR